MIHTGLDKARESTIRFGSPDYSDMLQNQTSLSSCPKISILQVIQGHACCRHHTHENLAGQVVQLCAHVREDSELLDVLNTAEPRGITSGWCALLDCDVNATIVVQFDCLSPPLANVGCTASDGSE